MEEDCSSYALSIHYVQGALLGPANSAQGCPQGAYNAQCEIRSGKTNLNRKQQYVSCLKRKGKTSHVLKRLRGGGSRAWRNQVRLLENHDTPGPRTRGGRDRQRRGLCGQRLFQVRETMHRRQAGKQSSGASALLRMASLCTLDSVVCVCVCVCVRACVRVMRRSHYLRLSLIRNAFEVFLEPYDQVGPLCKDWEEGTLPVREAVTLGKGRTGDLTQENGHFINTLY